MRVKLNHELYDDRGNLCVRQNRNTKFYRDINPEQSTQYHQPASIEKALSTSPVKRGDIVLLDFGNDISHCKIIGSRPAIVLSGTEFNMTSPIITVIPMTKNFRMIDNPEHVFVDREDCEGLRESGMAMCEQMCSADRSQVIKKIGVITDDRLMDKINNAAKRQIGIYED